MGAKLMALLLSACLFLGCGYHVANNVDALPKNVKTIAIPPFGNTTIRYKLSDQMAAALTREFNTRTRYHIVADPNEADAVLTGSVINYFSYPTVFDPTTNRAAGAQAIVQLQLTLRDRVSKKVLFSRPHMDFRQNYEISVDPSQYFDESDAALDRASQEVARKVVSSILENF